MRAAELAMAADGVSLVALMERAGAQLADLVWRSAAGRAVLILCGPGNNGGDGYVAARLLAARGAAVRIAASGAPTTDLAKAAAAGWAGRVEQLGPATAPAPVLVDALFGIGLTRPLAPELTATVARLAQAAARRIAVDVPSGVASDSGACLTPVPAFDVTLALGALKPAHVLLPAAARCGVVQLATLGIRAASSIATLPAFDPPPPDPAAHKYSRGQVLVVAGPMAGAANLAAAAALRAGAGHVLLAGAGAAVQAVVADALPLAERLRDRRLGAVVLGPGSAPGKALAAQAALAVQSGKPLVLDASAIDAALPLLKDAAMVCPPAILTPHSGEFDRAFGAGAGSKLDRTLAAARASGAVVIHKGADTIIASPDGRAFAAWPGSPHLASAGTGDVLAGACGAMLAQGHAPFEAAARAVWWHINQARRAGAGLIADDLVGAS
jgi:hydroxyethylthiazole kinase-like uncharacterized protein yjeF